VAAAAARLLLVAAALGAVPVATASAQGSASATTTSALPFRIGEYNEYDLKFGVISVGSGSLSVSGPDTVRGRETLRLRYEIRGGIPLFRVHDVMESWFDAKNMLSMRFTQDLNEGPKRYNRFYDFYPDEEIVLERGKPRAATVAAPLDDASFIFFVRTLKLEDAQFLALLPPQREPCHDPGAPPRDDHGPCRNIQYRRREADHPHLGDLFRRRPGRTLVQ
jgi:hypothetical protein